jgi:hypothetical protein
MQALPELTHRLSNPSSLDQAVHRRHCYVPKNLRKHPLASQGVQKLIFAESVCVCRPAILVHHGYLEVSHHPVGRREGAHP